MKQSFSLHHDPQIRNISKEIEYIKDMFDDYLKNHQGLYEPMDDYARKIIETPEEDLIFVLLESDFETHMTALEDGEQAEVLQKELKIEESNQYNDEELKIEPNSEEKKKSFGILLLITMSGIKSISLGMDLASVILHIKNLRSDIDIQIQEIKQVIKLSNKESIKEAWNKVLWRLETTQKRNWTYLLTWQAPEFPTALLTTEKFKTLSHSLSIGQKTNIDHQKIIRNNVGTLALTTFAIPTLLYFSINSVKGEPSHKDEKIEGWLKLIPALIGTSFLPEVYRQVFIYKNILKDYKSAKLILTSGKVPDGLQDFNKNLTKFMIENGNKYGDLTKSKTPEVASQIADAFAAKIHTPLANTERIGRGIQKVLVRSNTYKHNELRIKSLGTVSLGIAIGMTVGSITGMVKGAKKIKSSKKELGLLPVVNPVTTLIRDLGDSLIKIKLEKIRYLNK